VEHLLPGAEGRQFVLGVAQHLRIGLDGRKIFGLANRFTDVAVFEVGFDELAQAAVLAARLREAGAIGDDDRVSHLGFEFAVAGQGLFQALEHGAGLGWGGSGVRRRTAPRTGLRVLRAEHDEVALLTPLAPASGERGE
jgi:hypothetical protein